MTLNRKKKDGAASGSSEKEEQSKAGKEACGDPGAPAQEEIKAGSGAEAPAEEKAAGDTTEEKQPSEADILKVYLKQALEEAKR